MQIIAHRRNRISELRDTATHLGVEVDIRSQGDRLIIHHDPFSEGVDFLEWVSWYQHGTLILNVKEEGLEARLKDVMLDHRIEDYFFLDQSFPFLIKSVREKETRCAVRVSEFESLDTALSLAGKVDWIWVDCFNKFPLTTDEARQLKSAGFKLCVVSPELQGRTDPTGIRHFREHLESASINPEAICTKLYDLWS